MAFPTTVDDLHTAIPAEVAPGEEGHYDHHRALATAVEAVETALGTTGDLNFEAVGAVATHNAETTSVHGIADTSALLTASAAAAAYQPLDADLTDIAALTPSEGDTLTYTSGHWTAAAPSGGGGGGTPGVDYPTSATVTLSSAAIRDLHNTLVEVVAAPGAGKWLSVHQVVSYYKYGTTQYATNGDPSAYIGHGPNVAETLADIVSDPVDIVKTGAYLLAGSAASDIVNTALNVLSDGSVFTLGDGTLTVTAWYTIEDVPA